MLRTLLLLVSLSVLAQAKQALAAPLETVWLYVSPKGDDNNDGRSKEKPFRTLQRASREFVNKPATVKDMFYAYHVDLRGTIELREPLMLSPTHFHQDLHQVVFLITEENATLSGGQKINGWTRDGKHWKTKIPEVAEGKWKFRELFVNGERRPRARTPNEGYHRIDKAGPDNRTSFTAVRGDLPNMDSVEGAEVVFFHDWCTSHIRLKSFDFASGVLETKYPIGNNAPHYVITHYEPHPRYYLENSPAFLDVPGEWYLDEKSGELTYYPLAKEFLEKTEFIAPRLTRLVEIGGTEQQPLEKTIEFQNIAFAHCAWIPPEQGYAGMQAAFFENREPNQKKGRTVVSGAVQTYYAHHVWFNSCDFQHLGGSGLSLQEGTQKSEVVGCTFRDIGANGLSIGEATSPRPNPKGEIPAEEDDLHVVTKIDVRDNVFENCGALYYGAVGIWIGMANNIVVERNELKNLPYTGISVGWMWNPTPTICGKNRIEANHIHHIMQALSDGAGIYTLGRQPGTVLRGNWIHDVPVNAGRAESNGIFMDEGSTDMLVENNTIHAIAKSPIRFHKAGENLLKNNTLVVPPGSPPLKFNNTKPELIKVESANVIEHAGKWEPEKKLEAGPKK